MFIASLEGSKVVVELARDTVVRGTLLSADDALNLQLGGGVTVTPLQGATRSMDATFIRGRHVRFIHLPPSLDPAAAVAAHRRRVAQAVREHAVLAAAQGGGAARPHRKGEQLEFGGGGGGQAQQGQGHGPPPAQQQQQQQQQQQHRNN